MMTQQILCYTTKVDIEAIILGSSYIGIFGLMVANGLFSFPSSQILYILVGYFVGTGYLAILPASLAGALGNALGNVILYEGVRLRGMQFIEKFSIFRPEDIKRVQIVFKKRGIWFLFVGKLLPAIKVFIPIPAGLAHVNRGAFAFIMFSASWIWSFVFIGIGYFFGKGTTMWKSYGILLLFIALTVLYLFHRLLYSKAVTDELLRDSSHP